MTTISTMPYFTIGDIYDKLNTKTQNRTRYTTYFTLLWNTLLEMFEYKNLPDTIPKRFLESILHSTGEVFVSRIGGELIASHGTLSGEVDAYGLCTDCIAVCPTGEARGKRGVDIAYGINNDTSSPDMIIYWISHLLGETDKSINLNVIYSRLLHIPKVATEQDKTMFEELIKKVMDGEPQAFASKSQLDLEFGAGTECFELTDVNKIEKLPYLTQFFEDCLKRFYNFYGQPMQNQNKRAQSISDEIHGQDSVSFILPIQMLNCRIALCDEINRIFGTDISVEFSPLWKLEFEALVKRDTDGDGVPDQEEGDNYDDNVTGNEQDRSSGAGGSEAEAGEEEQESTDGAEGAEGAEADPVEPEEPEEPFDIPAMSLDEQDGAETEREASYNIKEIAEALGVSEEEVRQIMETKKEME